MPKEWQEKAEAEYRKYADRDRKFPEHVRFVTYTTRWHDFGHGEIDALEKHYDKAVILPNKHHFLSDLSFCAWRTPARCSTPPTARMG